MGRPLKALIDTKALTHNLSIVQQFIHQKKIIAMVKSNAYGHGFMQTLPSLSGADAFGVASLEEAQRCRQLGVDKPIILMQGFLKEAELTQLIHLDLETVVHHIFQVNILMQKKLSRPLKIWIKVNTGMNRLGIPLSDSISIITKLADLKQVEIKGLMTHFSSADELDNDKTQRQFELFAPLQAAFPTLSVSLANSAAILKWPRTHGDWVRPGLILYGVSPFPNTLGSDFNLKPVMQLQSEIIAIHTLKKGDTVGYGDIFCAPKTMPIATVAVGYGDGYPRNLPTGTPVLVNGCETQLLGRVSMDLISVDLSAIPDPKIGDPVILWGKSLPIERVAQYANMVPYSLLTGLNFRVPLNKA